MKLSCRPVVTGLPLAAWLALGAGCGGGGGSTTSGPVFIAYARDFQGFESWKSETFDDENPGGSTHVAGLRTIYLNHAPPPGATEFPIGTIIVKKTQADGKIFAQVKRGGGYNAAGAVNWEWYEISEDATGTVSIRWGSTFPPAGEAYGGDPTGGCNICHKAGAAHDYVIAPGLTLAGIVADGGADAEVQRNDAATETGAADAAHE